MKVAVIGAEDTSMRRMLKFLPNNADFIVLKDLRKKRVIIEDIPSKCKICEIDDFNEYDEAIKLCEEIILFTEEESEDTKYIKDKCEKLKKKLVIYEKQP